MYHQMPNKTWRTIRGTKKVEAANRVLNNLVDAPSNADLVISKTSYRVLRYNNDVGIRVQQWQDVGMYDLPLMARVNKLCKQAGHPLHSTCHMFCWTQSSCRHSAQRSSWATIPCWLLA
jgi:hypothetical protein